MSTTPFALGASAVCLGLTLFIPAAAPAATLTFQTAPTDQSPRPRATDESKMRDISALLDDHSTLTPSQQVSIIRSAMELEREHYAAEVLRRMARMRTLAPEARAVFFEAVAGLREDHYAAEMLRGFILAQRAFSAADVTSILRAAPKLEDHYAAEILKHLLEIPELDETGLLGIIAAARPLEDHYQADILRKVVRGASERVRAAAVASAEQLARHYRDDIVRSAERRR